MEGTVSALAALLLFAVFNLLFLDAVPAGVEEGAGGRGAASPAAHGSRSAQGRADCLRSRMEKAIRGLRSTAPDIVFIGNSVTISAYDVRTVGEITGLKVQKICWGGSYTPWWYLALKNVVVRHGPSVRAVVFTFRFHHFTRPPTAATVRSEYKIRAFSDGTEALLDRLLFERRRCGVPWFVYRLLPLARLRMRYQRGLSAWAKASLVAPLLGMEPGEVEKSCSAVLSDERMDRRLMTIQQQEAEKERKLSDVPVGNGLGNLEDCLLPYMLRLGSEAGKTMVFVRCRTRLEVERGGLPDSEKSYLRRLGEYLAGKGAVFIDLSGEKSITVDCFRDAHHFNEKGRAVMSRLVGLRLREILSVDSKPSPKAGPYR